MIHTNGTRIKILNNYQHYFLFYYIYLCVFESVCRSENNLWLWGVCTLLPSEAWEWNSVGQAW